MTGVTILGATGSIGLNTLQVLALHHDSFEVVALTANTNVDGLFDLCVSYRPKYAVMQDESAAQKLEKKLRASGSEVEVLSGVSGLTEVVDLPEVDYVVAGIVGSAGLLPTLAAVRSGKRVLLANKEALVMAGELMISALKESGGELLPIDSEHSAIFQCMPPGFRVNWQHADTVKRDVNRILLTASGGPFREWPLEKLDDVTPRQACAHPNWLMGPKISVDCATMINKGLEVIEASWLFSMPIERIHILLHPQSIVHSLVEYIDGSLLAQLGSPDMRTPIAQALAWPARIRSGVEVLDLLSVGRLDFVPLDRGRYPCLALAYQAMDCGGTATTILNAANEIAVEAFLKEQLQFTKISRVIEEVLNKVTVESATSLEIILAADAKAREVARKMVKVFCEQSKTL